MLCARSSPRLSWPTETSLSLEAPRAIRCFEADPAPQSCIGRRSEDQTSAGCGGALSPEHPEADAYEDKGGGGLNQLHCSDRGRRTDAREVPRLLGQNGR